MRTVHLPGPRNRFLTTWRFMRDPYGTYADWHRKYGETFLVPALNGDVVGTCKIENIRRIFAAPSEAIEPFAMETVAPLIGRQSVFLLRGEQHRRERSMMSPSFYGEEIANKAHVIRDIAMRAADSWSVGETIQISDAALDVSLEVIVRVVFGVQSHERVQLYKRKIKQFVTGFHPALAFSRLLHRPLFGLSPWNRFVKARADFHQLLDAEISERRRTVADGEDLLSRMLDATYDDGSMTSDTGIRDQLVTMLMAGHETTQIAMAWAMSWIHRHAEVRERLTQELDNLSDTNAIVNSDLLDGICNESLRLNPIVADVVRRATKPIELVETTLPVGSAFAVAICLVHSNPEIYPRPDQFDPDRWIASENNGRQYKPFEFMPFGGGVRRCIGASLAILEMKITISTWVKHFVFSMPEDAPAVEPVYRRNITMAPRSGIPLVFQGARSPAAEGCALEL